MTTRPTTTRQQHYNHKGFSLLELILVVVIIALLISIAVDKLLAVRVSAEQVAMQQVLGSLKSAMSINTAAHIVRNNMSALVNLEGTNPMDWLAEKPDNYLGPLNEPEPQDIKGYSWYYDTYSKLLIYRVSNDEFFKTTLSGPARAQFKVMLDYTDWNKNGTYEGDIDEIHGLVLTSIDSYEWTSSAITLDALSTDK